MVNSITLTSSMRSNLSSLKTIATQMDKTQNILSTGKKVNSAIDNASSYYQARSLTNRASDLNALLDSMGQGIQTIQAATQGIEAAIAYLEQMKSIAEQALALSVATQAPNEEDEDISIRPIEEFEALGYTVVPEDADASDIETMIAEGTTKFVLSRSITLSDTLDISNSDIILEGNGHSLTYNSESGGSAIVVDGTNSVAQISNLKIEALGSNVNGIQVLNGGCVIIDNPANIEVSGTNAKIFQNGNDDAVNLYNGKANTQAIVDQIGADGLAAYATTQFYVSDKNGDFGQGKWYLPSMGELMDMYGTDTTAITGGNGTSGASSYNSSNMKTINDALGTLASKDASIAKQMGGYYWSSSEASTHESWRLGATDGARLDHYKNCTNRVRCLQLLENFFNPSTLSGAEGDGVPQIGDVVYSDKSYGSANNFDGSKTAVGVICNVGEDGSVKIINLKDLTFSSDVTAGNFDADNPYSGSYNTTSWASSANYYENIKAITNYNQSALPNAMKSTGTIVIEDFNITSLSDDIALINDTPVENTENITTFALRRSVAEQDETPQVPENTTTEEIDYSDYVDQYEHIINEFNTLIEDASYQGVNLLTGGKLNVTFNESRTHNMTVNGKDMRTDNIGLTTKNWNTKADIETAIKEVVSAINEVRSFSSELGNNYTIIQTRQSFTDALCDVLETGADDLVLADMNEASAEYLMLQTRQQLAVNSLSLASQSASSILSLF